MAAKQIEKRIELTAEEAGALRRIQNRVDGDMRQRFQLLRDRLEQEQLTTNEHQELKGLVDAAGNINAARMDFLAAIAHDRGTTLANVVQSLSIGPLIP